MTDQIELAANEAFVGGHYTDHSKACRAAASRFNLSDNEFRVAKAAERRFRIVRILPAEDPAMPETEKDSLSDRTSITPASFKDAPSAAEAADLEAFADEMAAKAATEQDEAQRGNEPPHEDSLGAAFADAGYPCPPATPEPDALTLTGDVAGEETGYPEHVVAEAERIEKLACALDPRQEEIEWNGVAACEEQARKQIGLPAWYRAGRRFVLRIEGDAFPQSSPHCWALWISQQLSKPVTVRDAGDFEALETYDYRAMFKAAGRAPRVAVPGRPKTVTKPSAPTGGARTEARKAARKAAEAAAAQGEIPDPPDFSAATHKPYRAKLARLVEMAEAGDLAGLEGVVITATNTSPRAMARYRDLCIAALKAQAAKP